MSAPNFSIGFLEISTNAQFARWDQIEDIFLRRLLDRLVVSCDGDGTPSSYEWLRPPAKWERLVAFLTKARELRDRHCPDMELMTRTVVFDKPAMTTWKKVLAPLGWRPEFRHWINLVDASEDLSGRDWRPGTGVCAFVEQPMLLYVDWNGTVVSMLRAPAGRQLRKPRHREVERDTRWPQAPGFRGRASERPRLDERLRKVRVRVPE